MNQEKSGHLEDKSRDDCDDFLFHPGDLLWEGFANDSTEENLPRILTQDYFEAPRAVAGDFDFAPGEAESTPGLRVNFILPEASASTITWSPGRIVPLSI